jgi:wyosine [tRNA(Phe)-imidazoG37] synthetase (radical SAM superfamily)
LFFDDFLSGLKAMRESFGGEYWLEVFLVAGVNDSDESVARIAELAGEIGPDRIHLNTSVRPPHDTRVKPVSPMRLVELARRFRPEAEVPTDAPVSATREGEMAAAPVPGVPEEDRVLQLIRRHPCTAEEAASALGLPPAMVTQALETLVSRKAVRVEWRDGRPYMVGAG